MPIVNRIAEFHPEMTAWRQDLHAHPETAFEEVRTSGIVAGKLAEFGCDEVRHRHRQDRRGRRDPAARAATAGPSACAPTWMRCRSWKQTGLPLCLDRAGRRCMPAAMTATPPCCWAPRKYLAETRNFDGTVYFIFQPAEEAGGGGKVMVEEGLFERFPMERVFGMHNWPGVPVGTLPVARARSWRRRPISSVTITGKGAHGAHAASRHRPDRDRGASIVTALQSVVARNVDPVDSRRHHHRP